MINHYVITHGRSIGCTDYFAIICRQNIRASRRRKIDSVMEHLYLKSRMNSISIFRRYSCIRRSGPAEYTTVIHPHILKLLSLLGNYFFELGNRCIHLCDFLLVFFYYFILIVDLFLNCSNLCLLFSYKSFTGFLLVFSCLLGFLQ